jgi:DNA-binding MarR family transcriptional regulator
MMAHNLKESVAYWLIVVSRSIRNKLQAQLSTHGLYAGQDLLLMSLWDEDGQTQAQLARRLDIQQATLTRMIKRMETTGTVRRKSDRRDRRVSRVFLTASGKQLRKPIEAIWSRIEAQAFQNLSTEERLLLRRLLMQLHFETHSG